MQGKLEKFEDLKVWQKAHRLVLEIYKITKELPQEERFALVSQVRRASVSIPANIAEGFKKRGKKDKSNFYNIAQGSLEELKYYLILSKDLGYVEDNVKLISDIEEINKMLYALYVLLEEKNNISPYILYSVFCILWQYQGTRNL
ncbi:MAG TPA: four helix bundle protein [bacterium]|jgi:four helix bundle protein|nr:four helix bundle protein [bacterium]HOO14550.1 four helix bundle protein [Candidatus Neomarinimicrobiota bacterium]HRV05102.1 four helix bundle protein [Candidatus Ratteibacteria bacterium]